MFQNFISLKPYNTFGIDVKASKFAIFNSFEELQILIEEIKKLKLPFLILGGGSNILLTKNFDGVILKNNIKGIEIISESENDVLVKSAAGEIWHEFVLFCIKNNYAGVENLSLIPGSVGAAPMQNIGAYGVEIKDVFHALEAYEIETGKILKFNNEQCNFGYRESIFKHALKNKVVILNVTFKLSKNPKINTTYGAINDELTKMGISNPTIKNVSDAVIAIRQSKLPDPKEIGNSGSFFKNPVVSKAVFEKIKVEYADAPSYPVDENHVKLAAGWLIEKAGWKGKRINNYGVHAKQALVLVNYGGATGEEIFNLSTDILKSIKEKFGVDLEREVNII